MPCSAKNDWAASPLLRHANETKNCRDTKQVTAVSFDHAVSTKHETASSSALVASGTTWATAMPIAHFEGIWLCLTKGAKGPSKGKRGWRGGTYVGKGELRAEAGDVLGESPQTLMDTRR